MATTPKNDAIAHGKDEIRVLERELSKFVMPKRLDRMNRVLAKRTRSLTILLDRIHNYHNVSAIIRSADAFGICDVHLVGDAFDYNREISLGTERWVELITHDTPELAAVHLNSRGYELVLMEPEENLSSLAALDPIPLNELPFSKKLALVFGNEVDGISPALRKKANIGAYIPMIGFVDSLNISVAAAIALYSFRVASSGEELPTSSLSDEERSELRALWLKRDVRGAESILRHIETRRNFDDRRNTSKLEN